MSNLTILGDTSGSVVLQAPAVSGSTTITFAAQSGTLNVGGPAFSAYATNTQSLSSLTFVKIQFNTEEFDTASCYDNSTNYRFTPNVAGYYQVNVVSAIGNTGSTVANTQLICAIFKNGSAFKVGGTTLLNNTYDMVASVSALVFLNGTTDYVEGYLRQISGGSLNTATGQSGSYFQASMVRAA